jgi:hypothetical protein
MVTFLMLMRVLRATYRTQPQREGKRVSSVFDYRTASPWLLCMAKRKGALTLTSSTLRPASVSICLPVSVLFASNASIGGVEVFSHQSDLISILTVAS